MARAAEELPIEPDGEEVARLKSALVRVGYRPEEAERWWASTAHTALRNRTAAEAWAQGDVVLVRRFVEVHVSERFAEGLAARPEVMQQLFDAAAPS
jgi:hypothetical protein